MVFALTGVAFGTGAATSRRPGCEPCARLPGADPCIHLIATTNRMVHSGVDWNVQGSSSSWQCESS